MTKTADQMLGLRRHCGWIIEILNILHQLFHFEHCDTLVPDRMSTSQQEIHDNARGPYIGLLGIGEDVGDLLRWLVEKGATFQKISYLVQSVLNCKSEVYQLDSCEIFVTA